jgi:hypothetical protein
MLLNNSIASFYKPSNLLLKSLDSQGFWRDSGWLKLLSLLIFLPLNSLFNFLIEHLIKSVSLIVFLIWLNEIHVWSYRKTLRVYDILIVKVGIISIIYRHVIIPMIDLAMILKSAILFLAYIRLSCIYLISGCWSGLIRIF